MLKRRAPSKCCPALRQDHWSLPSSEDLPLNLSTCIYWNNVGDKSARFIHALSSHVFLSFLWRTISEHSVNYQSDLRYITKLCQRHQEPARLCRLTLDHLLWKHLLPSCHQHSCQTKSQFEVMHCTVSSQATALYHFLGQKGLRHFLENMCPLVL